MDTYLRPVEVRWADLDPNFHVRHSVFYDWGAYCRMCFLTEHGLTIALMKELHFGPIIFREECHFRKEIQFGDLITIDLQLLRSRLDYSRWSIQHHIYKNGETVAATISIDGTWLDTQLRKLVQPPEQAVKAFSAFPRSPAFEWINK